MDEHRSPTAEAPAPRGRSAVSTAITPNDGDPMPDPTSAIYRSWHSTSEPVETEAARVPYPRSAAESPWADFATVGATVAVAADGVGRWVPPTARGAARPATATEPEPEPVSPPVPPGPPEPPQPPNPPMPDPSPQPFEPTPPAPPVPPTPNPTPPGPMPTPTPPFPPPPPSMVHQRQPVDEDLDRPLPVPVAVGPAAGSSVLSPHPTSASAASGYAQDDWRSHMLGTPTAASRGTVYGARQPDPDSSVPA